MPREKHECNPKSRRVARLVPIKALFPPGAELARETPPNSNPRGPVGSYLPIFIGLGAEAGAAAEPGIGAIPNTILRWSSVNTLAASPTERMKSSL